MNFVTELLESKDCNAIFMIIDGRLIKIRHYIICRAKEKETSAEQTAQMYIKYVWKHYRLSKSIILDRDLQFILMFWTAVYKMLKIKMKLSTAFYS